MSMLASKGYTVSLAAGTIGGLVMGHIVMRLIKRVGCVTGIGILGYEVAHHNKIVPLSSEGLLETIQTKTGGVSKYLSSSQFKSMAGKNKPLAIGLLGGSLLGLAST